MQTQNLNYQSPLHEKLEKSPHSLPLKKQSGLAIFHFKSQKVLNTLSKVHPKHSKAYYLRLRPLKPKTSRISSKKCAILNKKSKDVRNDARSESIRRQKEENFNDIDHVQNHQALKHGLYSSKPLAKTQKNSLKTQGKTAQNTKFPHLDLKSLPLSKAKSGPSKFKHLISKGDKNLIKDFISEFTSVISEVDLANTNYLNYSQFCKVLNLLKFIENSFNKSEEETELVLKAWRILGGFEEGKIKVEDLSYFLLSILDVHFKIDQPITNSPQVKQKKTFWSLPKRDQDRLPHDFRLLVLNRTTPKITRSARQSSSSSSSQEISDSDTPEIVIVEASICQQEKEKIVIEDPQPLPETSFSHSKLIRRISLRELSNTPNGLSSKCLGSQKSGLSICETPKNLSFNASISEDLSVKPFYSPKSQDSRNSINKIQIRRVSTKSEIDLSKQELNISVSYKNEGKFRFPGLDENSDSSILNISEVQPSHKYLARRSNRIPTITERGNEELKYEYSDHFLDSFAN